MHTVGVQRQYTGTAGRIENAQVGVFLAGVPEDVVFATRSELADDMITAAVNALVPARWVAAGEAYGNSTRLRGELCKLRLGHVLAVFCDHLVPIDAGKRRCRADRLAAELPATAWTRRSAGDGSKGPRFYDWAWLADVGADGDGRHGLLIRRNSTTGEPLDVLAPVHHLRAGSPRRPRAISSARICEPGCRPRQHTIESDLYHSPLVGLQSVVTELLFIDGWRSLSSKI
ncbi:transposase [Actinoplanes sp. NPDC049802]|uniref:transposase n=1 Tax=Actinoplanes sp. NPDC049802 TaxID=3154742 RepID=UPI0033DCDA69